MSNTNKNTILTELINKQKTNIIATKKMNYKDMIRIIKNLDTSIFLENCCSIWNGYIVNDEEGKSSYINFYFKGKKISLHRLLYINYVGPLADNEYVKFICKNRGKCCNINHMVLVNKEQNELDKEDTKKRNRLNFSINFD